MAELEQTARYALKIMPPEVVRWCVPTLDPDLGFARWLDTQMIAFPGEPDRRCDTVAELVSRSGRSPPWALVLELEARPRSTLLARALEYRARVLRKLRHEPFKRDSYLVAVVVLFLSGRRKDLTLQAVLPGTNIGHDDRVGTLCLAGLQAAALLGQIDRQELGLSILVWIPLLVGGHDPLLVREWVRLALRETNAARQAEYAGLALVFAAWKGYGDLWKKSLEGFNVEEISIVKEWKDSARLEEKRGYLLRTLGMRFPPEVPTELTQVIQQTKDLQQLSQWFDAAMEAPSLEAFRSMILPSQCKP